MVITACSRANSTGDVVNHSLVVFYPDRCLLLKWSICKAPDAQLGTGSYGCGSPIVAAHTGILRICACTYMYPVVYNREELQYGAYRVCMGLLVG